MGTIATLAIGVNPFSVFSLTADALGDANKYFAAHINAAEWDAADSTTKKQALITAARGLDRQAWTGAETVNGQALAFPRTGITRFGVAVADGTPDDIALGEFELALSLLRSADTLDKRNTRTDIRAVGAGSAKVEFFKPAPGEESRFPVVVNEYIAGYLEGANSTSGVPFDSGTDVADLFSADDGDRQEPFA